MNLQSLPFEVFAQILQYAIAHEQSNPEEQLTAKSKIKARKAKSAHIRESLALRLVSQKFDDQISRIVIQEIEGQGLDKGQKLDRKAGIHWMLLTKARIHARDTKGPFAFIHDASAFLEGRQLGSLSSADAYVSATCRAIMCAHDPSWVVDNLIGWTTGVETTGPLSEFNFYHRRGWNAKWWAKELNPDGLYGALQLAVVSGSSEMVQKVIATTSIETLQSPHSVFGAAMRIAIDLDRVDVVTALIRAGVGADPFDSDDGPKSTLLHAAEMDRREIVNFLMTKASGIQVNAKSNLGHTALLWAARRGWSEEVRLLLGRDEIDVNQTTKWGEGVLGAAARRNDDHIVQQLLERADFHPSFFEGRYCPIWLAVENGADKVLRLMLDHYDLDPNLVLWKDHTALSASIEKGYISMAHMLLSREDVDPNYGISPFTTPLYIAVSHNQEEIVEKLLQYDAGDLNFATEGYLILRKAVEMDHAGVCKLILSFILHLSDEQRQDTLLILTKLTAGREILQHLVGSAELRIKHKTQLGRLLFEATRNGRVDLVEELVSYDEVDPNYDTGGNSCETPLAYAAHSRRFDILRLLLTRPDIDVNKPGYHGTALVMVIQSRDITMLRRLLEHPAIDINLPSPQRGEGKHISFDEKYHGTDKADKPSPFESTLSWRQSATEQTPLITAVRTNNIEIFSMLFFDTRIDPLMTDGFGRNVLWWASYFGTEIVINKILARQNLLKSMINSQDHAGWAPLHLAAHNGNLKLVTQLLDSPDINPNVATEKGWTALHVAMARCSKYTIELLQNHPRIDTSLKLEDGRTPLDLHRDCRCYVMAARKDKRQGLHFR